MSPKISIIVHGHTQALALGSCLDAILLQKKIQWIDEVLVLLPPNDERIHSAFSVRQKEAPQIIIAVPATEQPTRDLSMAIQVAIQPWLAFLCAYGIPTQDCLEIGA